MLSLFPPRPRVYKPASYVTFITDDDPRLGRNVLFMDNWDLWKPQASVVQDMSNSFLLEIGIPKSLAAHNSMRRQLDLSG